MVQADCIFSFQRYSGDTYLSGDRLSLPSLVPNKSLLRMRPHCAQSNTLSKGSLFTKYTIVNSRLNEQKLSCLLSQVGSQMFPYGYSQQYITSGKWLKAGFCFLSLNLGNVHHLFCIPSLLLAHAESKIC